VHAPVTAIPKFDEPLNVPALNVTDAGLDVPVRGLVVNATAPFMTKSAFIVPGGIHEIEAAEPPNRNAATPPMLAIVTVTVPEVVGMILKVPGPITPPVVAVLPPAAVSVKTVAAPPILMPPQEITAVLKLHTQTHRHRIESK